MNDEWQFAINARPFNYDYFDHPHAGVLKLFSWGTIICNLTHSLYHQQLFYVLNEKKIKFSIQLHLLKDVLFLSFGFFLLSLCTSGKWLA
jgi:hypothetical protein